MATTCKNSASTRTPEREVWIAWSEHSAMLSVLPFHRPPPSDCSPRCGWSSRHTCRVELSEGLSHGSAHRGCILQLAQECHGSCLDILGARMRAGSGGRRSGSRCGAGRLRSEVTFRPPNLRDLLVSTLAGTWCWGQRDTRSVKVWPDRCPRRARAP